MLHLLRVFITLKLIIIFCYKTELEEYIQMESYTVHRRYCL